MNKIDLYQNGDFQRVFQMTFENGMRVSIAFGDINYCDQGKTTAEVWAWDTNDGDKPIIVPGFSNGDVVGHLTVNQILIYMNTVANMKSTDTSWRDYEDEYNEPEDYNV